MPEGQPTTPAEALSEASETAQLEAVFPQTAEQAVTERLVLAHDRLGTFFDTAVAEGKVPARKFIHELNIPRLERIFPSAEIQKSLEAIAAIPETIDRATFIDQVKAAVEPFIRAEMLDVDVRMKVDAMHEEKKMKFTDPESEHALLCTLREVAQDLTLQDDRHIHPRDKVLEVSWSDDLEGPKGFKSVRRIFREIARYMREHEEVQAVTGVSWMMSHPLARRFGFEVQPDVEFPVNQKIGSAKIGNAARQGKPYAHEIATEEVLFGIISRESFLQRYAE